jgi:hypothetical protein
LNPASKAIEAFALAIVMEARESEDERDRRIAALERAEAVIEVQKTSRSCAAWSYPSRTKRRDECRVGALDEGRYLCSSRTLRCVRASPPVSSRSLRSAARR